MKSLDLQHIESELKKRTQYSYQWYRKQNDEWDAYSQFIYHTPNWEELIRKIAEIAEKHQLDKHQIFQYASNRWFNFWSAKAVEQIFAQIDGIVPVTEEKDSEKDFYLFGIPFDHKTTVFPKQFGKSFAYAQAHKTELIEWLYKNQSTQKRYHLKNRLFLVVHDDSGDHWKLKAEISILKEAIEKYVQDFQKEHLCSFAFSTKEKTLSDVIWVSK